MSIQNASLQYSGTVLEPVDGTAQILATLQEGSGKHDVYFNATSLVVRNSASFSVKSPKVNASAPSGYTQARSTILLRFPVTAADSTITYSTLKIELATDISMSSAQIDTLRSLGAQMLASMSDLDEFWHDQSLA